MGKFESVALLKCDSYEYNEVGKALEKGLSLIDGLDMIKEGMKVCIKANMVSAHEPDRAVTTHPVIIKKLCELLTEKGARVVIGDSPGGLYTPSFVKNVYKSCGFYELEREGVSLNNDFSVKEAEFKDAVSLKSFSYTGWLDDADVIINISKLKTHAMMGMSCAVKNMFGTVPGTTKPEYHMRFPEEMAFANVMVDLNEYFRPNLYIVDAIDGMEGNGPTAGEKRHIGALLMSKRPYALDMLCADIIGMELKDVATIKAAFERGLGPGSVSEVDVVGDYDRQSARITDFKRATIHQSITFEGGTLFNSIKSAAVKLAYTTKPLVKKNECIGCKKCHDTCPAKAITMVKGGKKGTGLIPQIDRSKCIKCFCCQEFCPVGAMKVHQNKLGMLLSTATGSK
ncbi:MAG: DUF362 domain-containing protein [Butyrivibrio sp.]|nr:DUF362 domain-containing protein [Butyrivibrio sp.]